MAFTTLKVEQKDSVLWCRLNRPEIRNAFNPGMIEELTHFARTIPDDVRCIVLAGEGQVFCAGGDLKWMKESLELDRARNFADAEKLATMLYSIDRIPVPVFGLIHGAAMGGGVGLVSVCDYAVATQETLFSFSEVKLGIIPACIAPFVIRKIGPGHSRALFTTAERFDATKAFAIGLIHKIAASPEEASQFIDLKIAEVLAAGPEAVKIAKQLVRDLLRNDAEQEKLSMVANVLAAVRVSPEGQEGLRAFLEKRKPNWSRE